MLALILVVFFLILVNCFLNCDRQHDRAPNDWALESIGVIPEQNPNSMYIYSLHNLTTKLSYNVDMYS